MSYPRDLDEHRDAELIEEICRRIMKQEHGLCTYCDRPSATPPCKFPDRHAGNEPHIFATLFDEIRARFSHPDPNPLPENLLAASADVMRRGFERKLALNTAFGPFPRKCTCNAPGGYPHEPDCPAWERTP